MRYRVTLVIDVNSPDFQQATMAATDAIQREFWEKKNNAMNHNTVSQVLAFEVVKAERE